ncbi:hypothetical protein MTO96_018392 [Rhipicephalus appendiculatus]
MPRTACVTVNAESEAKQRPVEKRTETSTSSAYPPELSGRFFLRMVVGCPASWSDEDVRKACEKYGLLRGEFYVIPVTTSSHVTYRNGFCALCNDDIVDGAFWNSKPNGYATVYLLPDTVRSRPAYHLRPCTDRRTVDTCRQVVPEVVTRKCKLYYAPVRDSVKRVTYKNVYCAMCNGANMSRLSCERALYVDVAAKGYRKTSNVKMAALFKPVTTTPTCRAFYNGRCYIPRSSGVPHPYKVSYDDEDDPSKVQGPKLTREGLPVPQGSDAGNYATPAGVLFPFCLVLHSILLWFFV